MKQKERKKSTGLQERQKNTLYHLIVFLKFFEITVIHYKSELLVSYGISIPSQSLSCVENTENNDFDDGGHSTPFNLGFTYTTCKPLTFSKLSH